MQEADEQDTCRICSAPAEPDLPLFHPCKCSGTIRYIHQDCLTTWLAHSKKKNCDVCKHAYSFTKVYAPDMPTRLPPVLLVRRLAYQVLLALLLGLRAVAVALIWLAVLPWVTVWTWRMYFSMGESTAWWISDRPRPTAEETVNPFYYKVQADGSLPPSTQPFLSRVIDHPIWLALSADIFTGQIIASLIVLTFVAIFLLREWISQNARPGVFEDEEVLPEEQPVHNQPEPVQEPQILNAAERAALLQQQVEAIRALDAMRVRDGINGHIVGEARHVHGRSSLERPAKKGKGRQMNGKSTGAEDSEQPSRSRRRLQASKFAANDGDRDLQSERLYRRSFSQRVRAARLVGARHRAVQAARGVPLRPPTQLTLPESDETRKFEFTFSALSLGSDTPLQRSLSESSVPGLPSKNVSANSEQPMIMTTPASPIFPPVALERPVGSIPFTFDKLPERSYHNSDADTKTVEALAASTSALYALSPPTRRPPLPVTTLPILRTTSALSLSSNAVTPLDSPSLATYRAPEELQAEAEAGPSRLGGYFAEGKRKMNEDKENDVVDAETDLDIEAEHKKYFMDPDNNEEDNQEGSSNGVGFQWEENMDWRTVLAMSDESSDDDERAPIRLPAGVAVQDDEDDEGAVDEDEDGHWEAIDALDDGDEAFGIDGAQRDAAQAGEDGVDQQGEEDGEAGEAAAAVEGNEELDGNVEDDMEGAMEAIGMRGPIYGVFQNAALMIFVLDTAIGVGIWIPFTIGKSTALLSLNPRRFLQILHLPIRAMRLVTDPVVDIVAFFLMQLFLPPIFRTARRLSKVIIMALMLSIDTAFGAEKADKIYLYVLDKCGDALGLVQKGLQLWNSWSSLASGSAGQANCSLPMATETPLPSIISSAEPYFSSLGKEVRISSGHMHQTWSRMALGQGPSERVFAVVLGYAVVGLMLAAYLNVLTVGNARTAGRAVRSAVRQQLLVLKVASFIFIELVTFPLGCGIILDLCTVWLFPEANLASRATFFFQAPLTAVFYHWVAGTMFMYSFAILLAGCRSVMRPGAMWFIKDPQDQNSHPIRDILDRPTFTQLRKIFVSGLMYSFVVACVVGSVAALLQVGNKSIMPFRWRNREPLSNVPVDLLFLHLVLPYTMHYFRPKKVVKKLATALWKVLAVRFRLTSYFFGGRQASEEFTPKHWNFSLTEPLRDANAVFDGSFRRVPATDNLALPRDMRATVAVTEEGEPFDEASKELMATQNAEASKAKRNIKDDYMVVYIPPHFRYRIIGFITSLWIIGAVILGISVALPIQLGRSFFKFFTPRDMHDGYSLIVGFYLMWACYLIGAAIDRLDKRRQRSGGEGPRADLRILVVKRGLLWVAKIAYMVLFLGIIIPTLISFVVDLYIILPIRFAVDPSLTPRIRVVDMWALGVLYAKIALHAHRIQRPNQITRGLQRITSNGWTHPDPITATREVIGPVTAGLIGMIVLPGALFRAAQLLLPGISVDDKFIFMHIYPGIFMFAGLIRSAVVLFDLLSSWSQTIRDKEFLVEMRLRNHEPEKAKAAGGGNIAQAAKAPGIEL